MNLLHTKFGSLANHDRWKKILFAWDFDTVAPSDRILKTLTAKIIAKIDL